MSKHKKFPHREDEGLGRSALVFDDNAVVQLLKAAVEREGDQGAFARRHGLNRSNISAILNGRRAVSAPVAKALGLCKVYIKAQVGE